MWIVPWWIVLSASAAPVVLVGGWTVAQEIQGSGYDPVSQSISILGAYGAPGYWVLTGSFLALGICYLVTAAGLRGATRMGRAALGAGGATPIALTLVPAPTSGGSFPHGTVATIGFVLLALWPVLAVGRGGNGVPWGLRPIPASVASALMWFGAAWFWVELHRQGVPRMPGVAERVVTFAQALWPLLVVISCRRFPRTLRGVGPVRGLRPALRRVAPDSGSELLPGGDSSSPPWNGRANGRANGRLNARGNGGGNGRANGRVNGRVTGRTAARTDGEAAARTEGRRPNGRARRTDPPDHDRS